MPETLPGYWYFDEAVHRRERDAIFAREWWLFGPEAELAEPGAYRAERICGWPLFALRGRDGILRGFHNVCRHRASSLLEEGRGRCEMLRCPYHGWLYEADGRLRKAPNFGEDPDFDPGDYGLFPVRVEVWRGLVFVSLDESPPDLVAWLGAIPRLCERFPAPPELEYHGEFRMEGAANWKTYCDNTVEGYHLPFVHPRLTRAVSKDAVELRSYDDGRLVAFHVGYASGSDAADLRGDRGLWMYRFPGFQLVLGPNNFKAERVEPMGPRALRSVNWSWFRDLEAADRRASAEWARQIVGEDLGICEAVQRNLEAGVYGVGRLSPQQESHVARFQSIVRQALESA